MGADISLPAAIAVIQSLEAENRRLLDHIAELEAERDEAKRLLDVQIAGHQLTATQATQVLLKAHEAKRTAGTDYGTVRVCPLRDATCPHGMACPYTDGWNCKPGWNSLPSAPGGRDNG